MVQLQTGVTICFRGLWIGGVLFISLVLGALCDRAIELPQRPIFL